MAVTSTTAVVGQSVTLTALVTEQAGGEGNLTGTVTFSDSSSVLGTAMVAGANGMGAAVLITSALAVGNHSITVAYSGDANNQGSATAPASPEGIAVGQDSTDVIAVSSASSKVYGQPVAITAIVSVLGPGAATPTGQISFLDGTRTLGTGTVSTSGGVSTATFSTAALAVGSYSITADYGGDANDTSSSGVALDLTIQQATPTIAWANPADITYGTALSATQLDATASVPGTFTYTPAAGTILKAGAGQTLKVAFTPTDSTDYATALATAKINVDQATPTITWANPADITYGTALSATQLDATASVPGTFTYTPAASAILKAGAGQTLKVAFTPTDSTDYTGVTTNAKINVDKAPLTITADNQTKTYGSALPSAGAEFTTSGLVNGDTVASVTLTSAGAVATANVAGSPYAITPSAAVGSGLSNYNITYATGTLTVDAAPLTITASPKSKTYGETLSFGSDSTQFTSSGLQNGETIGSVTLAVGNNGGAAVAPVGSYTITPSTATGGTFAASNYNISYATGDLTVDAAPLTITASPKSKTYGETLSFGSDCTQFTSSGLQNGETIGSVTLAVGNNGGAAAAPVGSYTITASAATGGTFTATNYNITYEDGTLTVNPAPLVTVTSVRWETLPVQVGTGKKARTKSETVVDIQFSGPLAGAGNLSAYQLWTVTTKNVKRKEVTTLKPIRLSSVLPVSSPLTTSVALLPVSKPNLALTDQLQITAAYLTDAQGRAMAGNNGQPGGNFVARLNGSGVISMAQPGAETRSGQTVAAAIDSIVTDGSLSKMIRREQVHRRGAI